MATKKPQTSRKKAGRPSAKSRPAPKRKPAPQRPPAPSPPRWTMPVPLQNAMIGLIIFMLTLGMGIMVQYVICALALGVAVYQLQKRRARWLWTWACFLAVGLYVVGVVLAFRVPSVWPLYFGAWIFVIAALVGETSRAVRRPRPPQNTADRT